jgi:ribosomal protein L7/L12
MNPVLILLMLAVVILLGYVLFAVFRMWGTMPVPTGMPPLANISLGGEHDLEIQQLIAQGKTIDAIKRVRELTGLGLKESKDYVDQLPKMAPLTQFAAEPVPSMPTAAVEQEIRQMLMQQQKIHAIKRVRELTGMGLKEAKDYVDSL